MNLNWIDIKARKPTKEDADKNGDVLQLLDTGQIGNFQWNNLSDTIAWMPIPPFDPLEIPEGWRVVDVASEKKTGKMKYWGPSSESWIETGEGLYTKDYLYITPIEPPAPTYRPFANAAEFKPFAQKEWRYKVENQSVVRPPAVYSDSGHSGVSWECSFDRKRFCDGQPFGMKVET